MENGIDKESGSMLFCEEELIEVSGLKKGGDFVEVTCGCTSHKYGDAVGKLRVFSNGDLEITCECTPGCNEVNWFSLVVQQEDVHAYFRALLWCLLQKMLALSLHRPHKLTPAAFEKHSGRETARKWKNNVWLIVKGEKVPLSKTAFLKYYNQASKNGNGIHKAHGGRVCHRDEFVRCSRCKKERRFRLQTKEECRIHHDALADVNWKCSDILYDRITCDDDEERASRRVYRGCSRSPTCKGCTSCVCFGCEICRFTDCSCQTCIDFIRNAKA
ncbi:protein ULTRAPETALA 1-like [Gossypium australe]|uniref:Protein ULTRAPETALA 1-like n=1 Tax=Gossypium australe TaxID=47621 RepID=A0A5B6V0A0_9ROSI|nr:protein ULTRAPETALA 1-like [Gossypium australe]